MVASNLICPKNKTYGEMSMWIKSHMLRRYSFEKSPKNFCSSLSTSVLVALKETVARSASAEDSPVNSQWGCFIGGGGDKM